MQIYCHTLLLNGTISANGGDGVIMGGGGGSGERNLVHISGYFLLNRLL